LIAMEIVATVATSTAAAARTRDRLGRASGVTDIFGIPLLK